MAREFGELELGYFKQVLASGQMGWADGGMVTRFEQAFAQKVGSRHGVARNSAMTALAQAVSISGAGCGTEVICDPLVHFGGISAIYFNAVPRFADVRYDTYLMDPASVRANITDKTRALIVTNLWGLCAELDEIRSICDEHGIFMIEDCAHNMGSFWKGKHAGTFGHVGCFSFQQSKHLTTGDGAMIVTDSDEVQKRLYHAAFLGEVPPYMRLNYRMNEVTGALGLAQLERLDAYIEEYTASLRLYDEAIRDCKWLRNRTVPPEAVQSGYIWVCAWEGDKHSLEYERFKTACTELGLHLRFGFIGDVAYSFPLFRESSAYGVPDCPVRCPFYQSDYRYHRGLCPNAEDLMPRLIMAGLIEVPPDEVKRAADRLRQAIKVTEQG